MAAAKEDPTRAHLLAALAGINLSLTRGHRAEPRITVAEAEHLPLAALLVMVELEADWLIHVGKTMRRWP